MWQNISTGHTITIRLAVTASWLLTKKELRKIESAARNNGFTIIPTRLFINDKGLAKVVVAIAKGKKEYDKRDSIKERDDRREMDRAFKR